jgi:DNA polymerase
MNKQKELEKIAQEIKECPACKKGGTGKAVPGEGSADALVMFIGEAPGREEAKTGRPFVGRSGKLLRRMITGLGIEENAVFITSPVHYQPITGKPSPALIAHGRTHLLRQIEIIKPRLIVLLGNTACRSLLEKNIEIVKAHGTIVEKDNMNLFISYHPAYAVRFPEGRKNFVRDFAALKDLLQE